ncbi:unnamed protein product [Closterium sp. NIES-54]
MARPASLLLPSSSHASCLHSNDHIAPLWGARNGICEALLCLLIESALSLTLNFTILPFLPHSQLRCLIGLLAFLLTFRIPPLPLPAWRPHPTGGGGCGGRGGDRREQLQGVAAQGHGAQGARAVVRLPRGVQGRPAPGARQRGREEPVGGVAVQNGVRAAAPRPPATGSAGATALVKEVRLVWQKMIHGAAWWGGVGGERGG